MKYRILSDWASTTRMQLFSITFVAGSFAISRPCRYLSPFKPMFQVEVPAAAVMLVNSIMCNSMSSSILAKHFGGN